MRFDHSRPFCEIYPLGKISRKRKITTAKLQGYYLNRILASVIFDYTFLKDFFYYCFLIQYLSRGIQFSRASLNGFKLLTSQLLPQVKADKEDHFPLNKAGYKRQ